MDGSKGGAAQSDALVLFGVSGDLAHKKSFPALYAMCVDGKDHTFAGGTTREFRLNDGVTVQTQI